MLNSNITKCLDLETILLTACKDGDVDLVDFCIENGANINCVQGENLTSPILVAVRNGHKDIIKMLIDNDVDLFSFENEKAKHWLKRIKRLISMNAPNIILQNEINNFTKYTNELKSKLYEITFKEEKNKQSSVNQDAESQEELFDDVNSENQYISIMDKINNMDILKPKQDEKHIREFISPRNIPLVIKAAIDKKDVSMLLFICEILVNKNPEFYFEGPNVTEEVIKVRALANAINYSAYAHDYDVIIKLITSHSTQYSNYFPVAYYVVDSLKNSENIEEDHLKVIEILKLLNKIGHNMDNIVNGETVFHLAARTEIQEFVEISLLLLSFPKVDWTLKDKFGKTPEPSFLLREELFIRNQKRKRPVIFNNNRLLLVNMEEYDAEIGWENNYFIVEAVLIGKTGKLEYTFLARDYREVSTHCVILKGISKRKRPGGNLIDYIEVLSNAPIMENSISTSNEGFTYSTTYRLPVNELNCFREEDSRQAIPSSINTDDLHTELCNFYEKVFGIDAFEDGVGFFKITIV